MQLKAIDRLTVTIGKTEARDFCSTAKAANR